MQATRNVNMGFSSRGLRAVGLTTARKKVFLCAHFRVSALFGLSALAEARGQPGRNRAGRNSVAVSVHAPLFAATTALKDAFLHELMPTDSRLSRNGQNRPLRVRTLF
jgi:hypothetical protein